MIRLQHDAALGAMRSIMDQLKEDIPCERRLTVMYLLYYSIRAALEKYEKLVERRERQLRPSRN